MHRCKGMIPGHLIFLFPNYWSSAAPEIQSKQGIEISEPAPRGT